MQHLHLMTLLAGSAAIAGCAAAPPPPAVAVAAGQVCDGAVTAAEWNAWRASGFGFWDTNKDNRIDRSEFEACYRAGGFYPIAYYNPDYWTNYWTAFDANGDGFLSADEYWSAQAWASVDRNRNGIIDSNEWVWWPM